MVLKAHVMSSQTDFAQLLILFANDVLIFFVSFFYSAYSHRFYCCFFNNLAKQAFPNEIANCKRNFMDISRVTTAAAAVGAEKKNICGGLLLI